MQCASYAGQGLAEAYGKRLGIRAPFKQDYRLPALRGGRYPPHALAGLVQIKLQGEVENYGHRRFAVRIQPTKLVEVPSH